MFRDAVHIYRRSLTQNSLPTALPITHAISDSRLFLLRHQKLRGSLQAITSSFLEKVAATAEICLAKGLSFDFLKVSPPVSSTDATGT